MTILSASPSSGNVPSFLDRLNHRAEAHKARVAAEIRQSILDRIARERDELPADDDGDDIQLF